MKRLTVLMFAVAVFLGGSASAFAQVISNICWNVNNGFNVKTSFTIAGSAAGSKIFDVDGFGTETNAPIKGTCILPPAGNASFSFLIEAASPIQHAVVYQLSVDRNGNGTGSWRWFDGSNEGGATIAITACVDAEAPTNGAPTGGARVSQGLQD